MDKTRIVHFRTRGKSQSQHIFMIGQDTVTYSDSYKYLGLWLHEHMDLNYTAKELAKSVSRALGVVINKCSHAGGMTFEVYNQLHVYKYIRMDFL